MAPQGSTGPTQLIELTELIKHIKHIKLIKLTKLTKLIKHIKHIKHMASARSHRHQSSSGALRDRILISHQQCSWNGSFNGAAISAPSSTRARAHLHAKIDVLIGRQVDLGEAAADTVERRVVRCVRGAV